MNDTVRDLLDRAIELAGGTQAKLGAACGYSQNAIHAARKTGRVSPSMAIRIEGATKGAVPARALCPELDGLGRSGEPAG